LFQKNEFWGEEAKLELYVETEGKKTADGQGCHSDGPPGQAKRTYFGNSKKVHRKRECIA